MKILLKRFHLNGNTIGFHPGTQKLKLRTKEILPRKSTVEEQEGILYAHASIWAVDVPQRHFL